MKTKAQGILLLILILCGSVLFAAGEREVDYEAYPQREIRIIVAFGPGGQSDLIARKIAEIIEKQNMVSQPVVVVNMPGGLTAQALEHTRSAKPDGHTYLLHHTNILTQNAMGNITLNYDDFDLLGGVVEQPFAIVRRSDDDRWDSILDFINDAKANPRQYSVGFPGFASPAHFALLQVLHATGAQELIEIVPYDGGAAAISAHLGGHVDLRATNMGDSARYVASGDLEYVIMIDSERNPFYPETPTLSDIGYEEPGLVLRTGIFAPKGIPEQINTRFMGYVRRAVETDEFRRFANDMSLTIRLTDSEEFTQAYRVDYASFKELAAELVD